MQQKKSRLLLVDDKSAVLLTYRMILQQNGYDVVAVPTCDEALGQLSDGRFDLLVCDLGLDGNRSGFEVIDFAKQQLPGIRSVLLTGYVSEHIQFDAQERGIAVLFKPVQVRELLQALAPAAVEQAIA